MKRRNFLQALGFTVAAKPDATTLRLSTMGVTDHLQTSPVYPGGGDTVSKIKYLKEALAKLTFGSAEIEEVRMRQFYVDALDPNTASLVSVSLTNKLRISRRIQYRINRRDRRNYIQMMLDGKIPFETPFD